MAHVKTLAVITVSVLCAGCAEAPRNCGDEVAAAFERLATSGRPYREEETSVVSDRQTFHEISEFLPPERMRTIKNYGVAGYGTVETIRIGPQAWSNEEGGRWREWAPGLAQEIYDAGMDFSLPDPAVLANTAFECLGRVEFKGTMYIGYRERPNNGMAIISADPRPLTEKEIQGKLSKLQQLPKERHTVFVDWPSILPAYDLFAPENQLDNPRSSKHYTYPGDITIEPPGAPRCPGGLRNRRRVIGVKLGHFRNWPIATDDALTANRRFRGIAHMDRFHRATIYSD